MSEQYKYLHGATYEHPLFRGKAIKGYLPVEAICTEISSELEKELIISAFHSVSSVVANGGELEIGTKKLHFQPNFAASLELEAGPQHSFTFYPRGHNRTRNMRHLERQIGDFITDLLKQGGIENPTFNSRSLAHNFVVETLFAKGKPVKKPA